MLLAFEALMPDRCSVVGLNEAAGLDFVGQTKKGAGEIHRETCAYRR